MLSDFNYEIFLRISTILSPASGISLQGRNKLQVCGFNFSRATSSFFSRILAFSFLTCFSILSAFVLDCNKSIKNSFISLIQEPFSHFMDNLSRPFSLNDDKSIPINTLIKRGEVIIEVGKVNITDKAFLCAGRSEKYLKTLLYQYSSFSSIVWCVEIRRLFFVSNNNASSRLLMNSIKTLIW